MQPEDRSQVATSLAIRRIAKEFGLRSEVEVARLAGLSVAEVARLTAAGGLLHLVTDGVPGYPSFQFGQDGQPRPIFIALAEAARHHEYSSTDLILWLCAPTGRLGDQRPIDLITTAPDRVLAAAEQSFSVEW